MHLNGRDGMGFGFACEGLERERERDRYMRIKQRVCVVALVEDIYYAMCSLGVSKSKHLKSARQDQESVSSIA
jgi:hypothetical protein